MSLARLKLKTAETGNHRAEAYLLSLSGIENGMAQVNENASWRTAFTNNTEYPSPAFTLGNGTMTYKFVDDDSNLSDDAADLATLYGIGRVGARSMCRW
jgi:hypothetical protein